MKILLNKIKINHFKGIKVLDVNFAFNTNILGDNATGKTSVMDAFLWLLFGKASTDRTAFEVKHISPNGNGSPKDVEVEGDLLLDDQPITLKRIFREKWVKKRGSATSEFSGHETILFYNEVPVSLRQYQDKIAAICGEDTFKMLTNPYYFPSLNWKVQRNILFELAGGEVPDHLIAQGNREFERLMNELTGKTLEEYRKQVAAQKKRITEELELIPARIDEVQRNLSEQKDWDGLLMDFQRTEKELREVEEAITDQSKSHEAAYQEKTNLQKKLHEARNKLNNLVAQHEREANDQSWDNQAKRDQLLRVKKQLDYPDNIRVFVFTDIGEVYPANSDLHVSQNYPNPFSALTYIDVFLAMPEVVSLNVYDLNGRAVASFEDRLQEGMHQFSFSAGIDKTYILTVTANNHVEKRIMLQMGMAGSAHSAITYLGAGQYEMAKTTLKTSDFNFNLGDNLKLTGFVTDLSGNMDYGVINDAPETSTEYLFDIDNTPPDQPSEISGENNVPVQATGLVYGVEEAPGTDYVWSVPNGWEITHGDGSHSITVVAGDEGGDITAKAENACGMSEASMLSVEVYVPMFELTLHVEPTEGGDVSGQGSYPEGVKVSVTATPNEGWEFTGWTGETDHVNDPLSSNTTVTMPAGDVTLTANFQKVELPTLTTLTISEITNNSAKSGGNVTNDGNASVTSRGIVWSTSTNPTTGSHQGMTSNGAGTGSFTSNLTGLTAATTYYVRAYATNNVGTAYGEQVSFITLDDDPSDGTVTDIDGNVYQTVIIGDQEWMAENLRPTRDANGNDITRYCYDDDETNCDLYGGLYTWHTVMNGESSSSSNPSGVQGICPTGWHVPSDAEWTELVNYVVSQGYPNEWDNQNGAGNALKSCRQDGSPLDGCNTSEHPRWKANPTYYGFDEFGFSALPGGYRNSGGDFGYVGGDGYWWASTEGSSADAGGRGMSRGTGSVDRNGVSKTYGFSLRCVRD